MADYIPVEHLIKTLQQGYLFNAEGEKIIVKATRSGLRWCDPSDIHDRVGRLFIVYSKGLPLQIAEWRTGNGFVNISTGFSIYKVDKIAYINLPEEGEKNDNS